MSDTVCNLRPLPCSAEVGFEDAPLKIVGVLSIGTAGELHRTFAERGGQGCDVVLDLSEVQSCDTASLQLIYSLHKTVTRQNKRLRIVSLSHSLQELSSVLGLRLEELTDDVPFEAEPGGPCCGL